MSTSKLLLFDFDGVIVDSFKMSYETAKELEGKDFTEDQYRDCFNGNIYEAVSNAKQDCPTIDLPFFAKYSPRVLEHVPIEGMRELIYELAKTHTLVIVSSTINSTLEAYLAKHDLSDCFKKLYGADIDRNKSVKTRLALADFGYLPTDAIFITDTLGDIREAAKAYVQAIAVGWGFQDVRNFIEANPFAIVNTPIELKNALEKWAKNSPAM